jgi:hypothetical protein
MDQCELSIILGCCRLTWCGSTILIFIKTYKIVGKVELSMLQQSVLRFTVIHTCCLITGLWDTLIRTFVFQCSCCEQEIFRLLHSTPALICLTVNLLFLGLIKELPQLLNFYYVYKYVYNEFRGAWEEVGVVYSKVLSQCFSGGKGKPRLTVVKMAVLLVATFDGSDVFMKLCAAFGTKHQAGLLIMQGSVVYHN